VFWIGTGETLRRMIGGLDLLKTPAIMTAGTTKKAKKWKN
jgi:hypothetical protein